MSSEIASPLILFFTNIDAYIIVLVRILGFVIIMPILSASSVPNTVKLLFSVTVAYVVFLSGKVLDIYYYESFAGFMLLVMQEFLVGFTMGFVVYIIYSTVFLAGQMIDYQIGFSMVSIFDPVSQLQVPITGNLLFFFIGALFVQSGAINAFINALFYSYDVLPVGGAVFLSNGRLLSGLITLIGSYFIIGVKIAMPVMGSILVVDVALGLLVKATPQMNIFVVGMPIKLFMGLFIIYFMIPYYATVQDYLFNEAFKAFMDLMGGLAPT